MLFVVDQLKTPYFGPASFSIDAGEIVGVCGESGAGKTVLLRALADLDCREGDMRLNGKSVDTFTPPDWRRAVTWLAPQPAWWCETMVEHFNQSPNAGLLLSLGLTPEQLNQQVTTLSEGQRQRFALLRLLVNAPRVLLLDEPTARLDEGNTHRVEEVIRQYVHETPAGALWVSHDIAQLRRIAQRVFEVKDKQLVPFAEGSSA